MYRRPRDPTDPADRTAPARTPSADASSRQAAPPSAGAPSASVAGRARRALGNHATGAVLQAKLTVGAADDPLEREADHVADQVMRMPARGAGGAVSPTPGAAHRASSPGVSVQRMCARCQQRLRTGQPLDCPDCESTLQRRAERSTGRDASGRRRPRDGSSGGGPSAGLDRQMASLCGRGRPLPRSVRSFVEPRFGHDFGDVRIHTGPEADRVARRVHATAFTVGTDVGFRTGAYRPETQDGRHLLAHELAHVVQQRDSPRRASSRSTLRRQADNEEESDAREGPPVNAQTTAGCNVPADCPDAFCTPYVNKFVAREVRKNMMPILLAGITWAVGTEVVPVWYTYLMGGASSVQDYTSRYGDAFRDSRTTRAETDDMQDRIERNLKASPPSFVGIGLNPDLFGVLPASTTQSVSVRGVIPGFINQLGQPGGMNFNVVGEIPGNLAGGIGANQAGCQVGANPSPIDDDRTADGTLELTLHASGDLFVDPSIQYTVRDTVDLCPGNCGTGREQIATVPMSRMEATGISGDVPYEVQFPAPMDSFTIPASDLPPIPGTP